jgi:SSS family solute:Na+ symporter
MSLSTFDVIVFVFYAAFIVALGLWISRTKKGEEKTSQDYFLANRSLTWWAIGASLIAANISAEHFIAMSGSGYRIGLGIAAYEWIAAVTLIIVGKYFIPVFLEKKIYTMPQFLKDRYNQGVSTAFAVFWLLVYVFVNLTSVSWLGALALREIMGIPLWWGVIGLAFFSGLYSIYGGLKAVAWTDVVQVIFLIGGGLVTTFLALDAVSGGEGILKGFVVIFEKATDHFQMIIPDGYMVPDGTGGMKSAFEDLPGLAVIFGAMWLTNLGYWGFNQYIIQKGLAAKDLSHAKRGLVFGGYLKILIPLLVLIPGITAFVLFNDPEFADTIHATGKITKADEAYPWLLKNFVPEGIRGLAFAALVAAIVSSLSSMINSTATIFTMDIYKVHFKPDATERQLVFVGRLVSFIALLIAVIMAKPLLGGLDQAFQYIQEYTGFIYPGVVVVFCMGLFWRQATSRAALWTAIITIPAGIIIKAMYPEMPFILRMGYVFIVLVLIATAISLLDSKGKIEQVQESSRRAVNLVKTGWLFITLGIICIITGIILFRPFYDLGIESIFMLATLFIFLGMMLIMNIRMKRIHKKAYKIDPRLFETSTVFNIGSIGIVIIITLLYFFFW